MKTILAAVVGTVGLLATPAVAGNGKKQDQAKKPIVVAEAATPSPLEAAIAKAIVVETQSSPELVAIPELPADSSNAFSQLPELAPPPTMKAMPTKAKAAKAPVLKMGSNYVLGARKTAEQPKEEVQQIVLKGLSQVQIVDFMNAHASDIQLCWAKVPAAQRADAATALLRLSISDAGKVTDIEVDGDVPAGAHKCITSAVARWQFPVAETSSDIEYGFSLHSVY
jgi:hypothetical protein